MRLIVIVLIFFSFVFVSYSDTVTIPGQINRFEIQNVTNVSAHVIWSSPFPELNVTQYELEAKILHTFSNESLYLSKWTFSNNTFRSEISNLHPGTEYNVTIKAISENGLGRETYQIFRTKIGEPSESPKEVQVIRREKSRIIVRISPVNNNNGPVSFYRLVVMNVDQLQVFQEDLLTSFEQAMKDGLSYYIAADIKSEDINKDFIIGDKKYYNKYYNAPLDSDARYYVFVGIISEMDGLTMVRFPDIASRRSNFKEMSSESTGLVIGLAVAVAVASVLLIIGVVVLVLVRHRFYKSRRQRLSDNQELCVQGPMIQVSNPGYIPDDELERVNHYDELKRNVWTIPRENLQIDVLATGDAFLGSGKFGHVVRGSIQKQNEKVMQIVACYVITDGDLNSQNKRLMLRQLDILIKAGKHDNVVSLVGTYESPETVQVVFEHSPLILKDMLLNHRHTGHDNKFTNISEIEMLEILIGISKGMHHLEYKNLIHEKLCARNILVFDAFIPKITGHGLSDYNKNNSVLDLRRWTAQEIVSGKSSTVKSDIWSYGCLMWEVCTLGGTPYSHFDMKKYIYEICRGLRLHKLPYISEDFYQLMISCWQNDPGERPTFHEITQQLIYFKETLSLYAHLNFDIIPDFSFEVYVPMMEVFDNLC